MKTISKLNRKNNFYFFRIASHFYNGIILPFDDSKSASDEDNSLVNNIFKLFDKKFNSNIRVQSI